MEPHTMNEPASRPRRPGWLLYAGPGIAAAAVAAAAGLLVAGTAGTAQPAPSAETGTQAGLP